jgi:hypothetical protein
LPQTSGGLNGEDLQVEADEEEEVDDGPGHVQNVLHKQRGRTEEEAEDIDQPSDEEEGTGTGRRRAPRATQVKFPTEEEF